MGKPHLPAKTNFDPYDRWLHIPSGRRPPSHFDLLGLPEGETDENRIQEAAAQRYNIVRPYAAAFDEEVAAQADRVLTEIAQAVIALQQRTLTGIRELPNVRETQAASSPTAATLSEAAGATPNARSSIESASSPACLPLTPQAVLERSPDSETAWLVVAPASSTRLPDGDASPALDARRWASYLVRVPVAVLRRFDNLLRSLAGEGNTILHNFLRLVVPVCAVVIVAVLCVMGVPFLHARRAAAKAVAETSQTARATEQAGPGSRDVQLEGLPAIPSADQASQASTDEVSAGPHAVAPPRPPQRVSPIVNSIGLCLLPIPPGEFLMGAPESDSEALPHERPPHVVRIMLPFFLSACEVTQEQYEKVTGSKPSYFCGDADHEHRLSGLDTSRLPVEQVSWEDAQRFCRQLSDLPDERAAGRAYRLPTEAEWEYACRAGTTTTFHLGDGEADLNEYGWFRPNSAGAPHSTGDRKPNAWGLYDMHGNVWEWCEDWYDEAYYERSPLVAPRGPHSGDYRVIRGGAWSYESRNCRSAARHGVDPRSHFQYVGFRVVCSVPAP